MGLAICQHVKLGGRRRCGSPAMRGQDYCYFHAGGHRAIPSVNLHPNNRRNGGCHGPRLLWPSRNTRAWDVRDRMLRTRLTS